MGKWRYACLGWLFCSLMALPAATAVATAPAAAPVSATPARIRVVADAHYPPFLFLDAKGKPQGYVADLWRLFEAHTGIKVELRPLDWPAVQPEVLSGRADVIGMLYQTPLRESLYDFSAPYAEQPVGIYVERSIRGVHDAAALANFPVGVERNGVCAEKLAAMGVDKLRLYSDYEAVIDAALHDGLRIFCMSEDSADFALYREGALGRFGKSFVLFTGEVRAAVRKGDAPMLAVVERGLAQITPAERAQLRKRWLEHPAFVTPYLRIARFVLALVAVVVGLMLLWVWTLRRSVARRTGALQEEKDKLRALLDASPDGLWVKDRDGTYRDCNDRVAALVGVERGKLLGRRDADVLDPREVAMVRATDEEVMRTGQARTHLFERDGDDGTIRQVEVVKVPLYAADGAVRGVLGVSRDITERLRSEAQLRLWAHAFQHAAFGVVVFDARTQSIIAANPVFARERGYTPEEMVGKSVHALYPEDMIEERRAARRAINRREHSLVETEHIARDGRRFPVQLDISITHDADGAARYVIVYAQDITERRRAEGELRVAAAAFQTQEALVVLDDRCRIRRINKAFTTLTGHSAEEALGQPSRILHSRQQDADLHRRIWEQARREGSWQGEEWIQVRYGRPKLVRMTVSAVKDADGAVVHFVCNMIDLTSEREAHASLDRMTFFDPLTDLPNRNFLLGRLQQVMEDADAGAGALLMFDLDHFKRINDLRGHAAGDRLLMLIAQRMRNLLDDRCVLCRFNGGTFAVLVLPVAEPVAAPASHAEACIGRVRQALQEPFHLGDDVPVAVAASIGWTELVPGAGAPESALREAELAMYGAKAGGRDQVCRFQPAMQQEMARHEALAGELRRAIDEGALALHLQAQVNRRGDIIGAEALLRWKRRDGEMVPPDVFIPVAEENGLIVPLGEWVLRRACMHLVAWAARPGMRGLSLAVNVSARQFSQPAFVEGVREVLAMTRANPARLKLEITETAILDDLADAAAKLSELRALGIRVSLDDFGTGYSSLAYLARLPLDQLKIDKSFVSRLPQDPNDAMVAQSIVGMGRGLGLEVIAEGVESDAQKEFLMAQGCDAFQGYLFARPLPSREFEAMLAARACATAVETIPE